jgi:hypothetical protein
MGVMKKASFKPIWLVHTINFLAEESVALWMEIINVIFQVNSPT